MSRMSLRARLTLAFAAGMTLVSLAVASFVYVQVRSDLRSEVDMGLRARAQALITERNMVRGIPQSSGHLADNDEAFAQVLAGDGRILAATRSVAREPLLRRTELRHDRPWLTDRRPTGPGDGAVAGGADQRCGVRVCTWWWGPRSATRARH